MGMSGGDARYADAQALHAGCGARRARRHAAGRAPAPRRARVVVVGGGFAGATCALQLRRLDPAIDVTLIDPDDRYVTCPMSDAALVGWRSMQSITVSRAGLARAGVRYVRDRVVSIDAQTRRVRLASSKDLALRSSRRRTGHPLPVGHGCKATTRRNRNACRMPGAPARRPNCSRAQLRAIDDGGVFAICVPPGLMRCPPGAVRARERRCCLAEAAQAALESADLRCEQPLSASRTCSLPPGRNSIPA